jgi:hypothetical protein
MFPNLLKLREINCLSRINNASGALPINPHAKLETLERQMALYRETLAERGKPFPQEIPIRRELFVAKDRDTALRTCLPYLERKYQTYVSWGQSEALPQEDTLDLPFDELRDQRFIIGSPDDCVE